MNSPKNLRILALSAYHGGSHAQFLEEWARRSRHQFSILTLPPRHFKWRIRQASVGFARAVARLVREGATFDVIWTTSMLDAAELRGLLPLDLRSLPLVVYFHENQLIYPVRKEDQRNQHFSLINWASALAADEVWFNSAFNRDSMLSGLEALLKKMPDENSVDTLDDIARRSSIEPPGIAEVARRPRDGGPLHIGWVGRWEHDKRPDRFFSALERLKQSGAQFRLTALGQSFSTVPREFERARELFREEIVHFGYAQDPSDYKRLLAACDVVVSTAEHEFFGVALLEGVRAGAVPLVPSRLVYPEIYPAGCLYEDDDSLVRMLKHWQIVVESQGHLGGVYEELGLAELWPRYDFDRRAAELDTSIERATRVSKERN